MSIDYPSIHSLYGRSFGITHNGYPTAQYGWKDRINTATSATTATVIPGYGITTIVNTTSAAPTYTLGSPETGVEVRLICLNAGTSGIATVTASSAYIMTGPITLASGSSTSNAITLSSASSGYTTVKFWAAGQIVDLVGLSTSVYLVTSVSGFSTSTGAGAVMS